MLGFDTQISRNRFIVKLMCDNGYTMRQLSNLLGLSKSTIHKAIHDYLDRFPNSKFKSKVDKIIQDHVTMMRINGGISTKKRWQKIIHDRYNNESSQ